MTSTSQHVLIVHYPLRDGEIRLRTEHDWDLDLLPTASNASRTRFEFAVELALTRPYLYFKPVLLRDGTLHWARGENYLAFANGKREINLYPYFLSEQGCTLCDLEHLRSPDGEREHALRLFLPPGYGENTLARYPVIYMQDGQNLFFPQEAFSGHEWMIDETLTILGAMNLIRKVIVAGIYPEERTTDYTLPGYEAYGRFLVDTVKPWVDDNHRTLPSARHTAVMGSSLGGVVSFYLAWQWPEVFGLCGCLSSPFGYRDDLLARVESEPRRHLRLYLDSGWPGDNYEVTRNMRNVLRARGYADGSDLLYLAFPYARHHEEAWAMRAHIPLQHFFAV